MITFEKIRDLERAEKQNKQLEKLPENIMVELSDYLKRKEAIEKKTEFDIREIENIKNTIKRLLEIREHKIMDLALYSARTGLPVENLTKTEEEMFNKILESLKSFRKKFYDELENPKPIKSTKEIETNTETKKTEKRLNKPKYRVIKEISNFIGPDGFEYSFKENDIINEDDIPKPLNDLLVKKGIIKKIE